MDELVLIRLKAHFDYVYPRIHNKKIRDKFNEAMLAIDRFDMAYFEYNKDDGSRMALDIYKQIVQIHKERFEEGRSGDFYLEKL